jgi:hypothetical protein
MTTDNDRPNFSASQIQALVVLMAEARSLDNNALKELAGSSLTGKENDNLVDLGLVETDRSQRPYSHTLTDAGWHFVRELHLTPPPTGSATKSLFTLLTNLNRSLERLGISYGEFFKRTAEEVQRVSPPKKASPRKATSSPKAKDPEQAIRAAYQKLATEAGGWVGLADLRKGLKSKGILRANIDEALRAMARQSGVRIIPVADTKNLTRSDKMAALEIGGEDNHMIAIGQQ